MQIYYIRHGQSLNNLLFDNTGESTGRSEDPDLSPMGVSQIVFLAEFIKTEIDHRVDLSKSILYSSPMIRAAKTAYAIKQCSGLSLHFHPGIYETGGVYLEKEGEKCGMPGITHKFVANMFPDVNIPSFITQNGWYNRPYETKVDSRSRAIKLVDELKSLASDCEIVFLVAHGSFFQDFITALLNKQLGENIWFHMNNCGVSRIDYDHNANIEIRYLNRFDFLPSWLIT